MPLTVADLIEPVGELAPDLFPDDTAEQFTARVDAYRLDGAARATAAEMSGTTADDAAAQWAYHRAYSAKYRLMVSSPASASKVDEGSKATLASQIDAWRVLADAALARFHTLTPVTEVATARTSPETRSTAIQYVW